jgi:hypothetical protein
MAAREISVSTIFSTVASLAVVIPVLWYVGKPLLSEAMAEDFKDIAQQQAQPIKSAFSVLLTRDINSLRKEIAALKFRQRQVTDWTEDDAEYLADLEIELEALREAKEKLEPENTS